MAWREFKAKSLQYKRCPAQLCTAVIPREQLGRLVHTGLGSSSLVAHVLPHANSFVLGPAVNKTHGSTCPPLSPSPHANSFACKNN